MMSGLMEILVVIAIILGIILLPRTLGRRPEPQPGNLKRRFKLTGWNRLAILATILWLTFFTIYLRPWNNEWHIFVYAGLSPVILSWGIYWTYLGFRKKGR